MRRVFIMVVAIGFLILSSGCATVRNTLDRWDRRGPNTAEAVVISLLAGSAAAYGPHSAMYSHAGVGNYPNVEFGVAMGATTGGLLFLRQREEKRR